MKFIKRYDYNLLKLIQLRQYLFKLANCMTSSFVSVSYASTLRFEEKNCSLVEVTRELEQK